MSAPTNAELLAAYRSALLAISTGQAYTLNGRSLTRANLPEVIKVIDWLEGKVAADEAVEDGEDLGGGIVLARFN